MFDNPGSLPDSEKKGPAGNSSNHHWGELIMETAEIGSHYLFEFKSQLDSVWSCGDERPPEVEDASQHLTANEPEQLGTSGSGSVNLECEESLEIYEVEEDVLSHDEIGQRSLPCEPEENIGKGEAGRLKFEATAARIAENTDYGATDDAGATTEPIEHLLHENRSSKITTFVHGIGDQQQEQPADPNREGSDIDESNVSNTTPKSDLESDQEYSSGDEWMPPTDRAAMQSLLEYRPAELDESVSEDANVSEGTADNLDITGADRNAGTGQNELLVQTEPEIDYRPAELGESVSEDANVSGGTADNLDITGADHRSGTGRNELLVQTEPEILPDLNSFAFRHAGMVDIDHRETPKRLASYDISEEALLVLPPKKKRRPAKFMRPRPSQSCHICSRTVKGNNRLVPCSRILAGICRKVICDKCFTKYDLGDFERAFNSSSCTSWTCTHCMGRCPDRAQCKIYERVNDKLRAFRLKLPASGVGGIRNRKNVSQSVLIHSENGAGPSDMGEDNE